MQETITTVIANRRFQARPGLSRCSNPLLTRSSCPLLFSPVACLFSRLPPLTGPPVSSPHPPPPSSLDLLGQRGRASSSCFRSYRTSDSTRSTVFEEAITSELTTTSSFASFPTSMRHRGIYLFIEGKLVFYPRSSRPSRARNCLAARNLSYSNGNSFERFRYLRIRSLRCLESSFGIYRVPIEIISTKEESFAGKVISGARVDNVHLGFDRYGSRIRECSRFRTSVGR